MKNMTNHKNECEFWSSVILTDNQTCVACPLYNADGTLCVE